MQIRVSAAWALAVMPSAAATLHLFWFTTGKQNRRKTSWLVRLKIVFSSWTPPPPLIFDVQDWIIFPGKGMKITNKIIKSANFFSDLNCRAEHVFR